MVYRSIDKMVDIEEKIKCLEQANHQYFCLYCFNKTVYQTDSAEEFYEHIIHVHPDLHQLECLFCDLWVTPQYYTDHYDQHISPNRINFAYNCNNCGLQTNLQTRFLQHECRNHDDSSTFNCSHCESTFFNPEALAGHINDYLCVIAECPYPNCMVKSVSVKSLYQHLKRSHEDMSLQVMSSSHIYCNSCGVLARSASIFSSSISHAVLQNALVSALLGGMSSSPSTNVALPPAAAVLNKSSTSCLVCPVCREFVTSRDNKLADHLRECPAGSVNPPGEVNYEIYRCKLCSSLTSTSCNYVKEHIEESHGDIKSEDGILREMRKFTPPQFQNGFEYGSSQLSSKRSHDSISDNHSNSDNEYSRKRLRLSQLFHNPRSESPPPPIEQVRFPIDYVALRTNFRNKMNDPTFTSMMQTLKKFSAYVIDIVNREGNRRIPRCPECGKVFSYGLSDFKRHLMCVHHGCDRNTARYYLRYLGMESLSPQDQSKEVNKISKESPNVSHRGVPESTISSSRSSNSQDNEFSIHLEYSASVLSQIIGELSEDLQNDLHLKMKIYGSKYVRLEHQSEGKRYYCKDCSYVSSHALADVRKHVLGSHCGISTKQFRFCLQASRLDAVNFKLLPDDELLRLANELLKRKKKSVESSFFSKQDRDNDSPGSSLENNNTIPCVDDSMDLDISANEDSNCDSINSNFRLKEITFPLRYSEPVLCKLLTPLISKEQYQSIVCQMNIFASYKITRIENGDRIIAFRCPCNRVFYADKQSNSNGRPSTLADCRRHVLGVHAKISPQYITACSQASRMSKETNYELYSDALLLKYASEAPIRNGGIKTADGNSLSSRDKSIVSSTIQSQNQFSNLRSALKSEIIDRRDQDSRENMEREVDLPFSRLALETLLEGMCPADFVDELMSKMEIYSSYRVYVLRVNGKRIYACSGCSSTSPHGMTDIRKHILGVHAKVPEKYKNVCMQASRLNRDDSSLLSDQNILVMAGAKPKDSFEQNIFTSETDDNHDEGIKSASNPSPPVFPEFEYTPDSQVEVVNPEPVSDSSDVNGYYPELSF